MQPGTGEEITDENGVRYSNFIFNDNYKAPDGKTVFGN
jgi:hypothetical protein